MIGKFGPARIVASIRDWENGVTVRVTYTACRYTVIMRDDDSGNLLPVARQFSRASDAIVYAVSLVH